MEQYSLILEPPLPPREIRGKKDEEIDKKEKAIDITKMSAAQKYMFAFSAPNEQLAFKAIFEEGQNRYKYQKY